MEPAVPRTAVLYPHARHRDHVLGLPVLETQIAQLGRGAAVFKSLQAYDRDLILVRLQVSPRLASHVVPCANWIALMFPLRWQGDYIFNGTTARPFDLFLSAGRDGYATSGAGRDTIAIGLRKSRLFAACCALLGGELDDIVIRDLVMPMGEAVGAGLRTRLLVAMESSLQTPLGGGRYGLPEAVEADLLSMFAELLLPHLARPVPDRAGPPNALRVVRAAQAAVSADPSAPANLADLCKAAGVGQAWLNRCFREVCGVSPYRYLRLWRLSAAREQLLDPQAPAASIKEVALSQGFSSSGRFAADYRAVFGENPSDTLLRTRQE